MEKNMSIEKLIYLCFIALLLISAIKMAMAETVNITEQLGTPTMREDNKTALGLSEIKGFQPYCGQAIGDYPDTLPFHEGATLPTTNLIIKELPVGISYCVFITEDNAGRQSVYSNYKKYTVTMDLPFPKPPFIPQGAMETVTIPWTQQLQQ